MHFKLQRVPLSERRCEPCYHIILPCILIRCKHTGQIASREQTRRALLTLLEICSSGYALSLEVFEEGKEKHISHWTISQVKQFCGKEDPRGLRAITGCNNTTWLRECVGDIQRYLDTGLTAPNLQPMGKYGEGLIRRYDYPKSSTPSMF